MNLISRIALITACLVYPLTINAQSPPTTLVSVNRFGNNGSNQGINSEFSISANGRFIAFSSPSTNLVLNDTNNANDIFVRDRLTGQTILVSVNADGTGPGDQAARAPVITPDGRFVAFISAASNLVKDDAAQLIHEDVFIRDLQLGVTKLVSRNFTGTARGNGTSGFFDPIGISDNGRFVVFTSSSTDLTAIPDTNSQNDVFVRDMQTNTTTLVSINKDGTGTGNNVSDVGVITPDGRYVAFISNARNLVAIDTPFRQVFVRDLQTNTTELVTPNFSGTGASSGGTDPGVERNLDISADGRFIVFASESSDLVANDNGSSREIFVRDTQLKTTSQVSINKNGSPATTGSSGRFAMTPDGRYVTFISGSDNLVDNDTNLQQDVFLRDLQTNTTTLISVNQAGNAGGNGQADSIFVGSFVRPSISDDGRYISFSSTNVLTNSADSNGLVDVFVRDRQTSTTTLVSRNVSGSDSGNASSSLALISRDGSGIGYLSSASNLVGYDANDFPDFFFYLNVEQADQIRFKFSVTNIFESGASATVTVSKLGPAGSSVTIGYATSDGSAVNGADYVATSGTLTFGPADTEKTFVVSILNDTIDEDDETITLSLLNVNGSVSTGEPSIAVVRILDDDPPPRLEISDVIVSEGDSVTQALFSIRLSTASERVVTVTVQTQNGTAIAGQDFGGGSLQLVYFPGQTLKQVIVSVAGDSTAEETENFFLNLINPVNATILDGQGVGTIIDNDALVLLTETGTERAIALDSVTNTTEPFSITSNVNFSTDHRTRILLFTYGYKLESGDPVAASVTAEDALGTIHPLTVEFAGNVPQFPWLTQVIVKLSDQLTLTGDVKIKITRLGRTSNAVLVAVKP